MTAYDHVYGTEGKNMTARLKHIRHDFSILLLFSGVAGAVLLKMEFFVRDDQ